ncbi:MAG: ribosome silencing factor [Bacilli bacterium]|nr:ribosome silencing factor [Bacilli bacterium]
MEKQPMEVTLAVKTLEDHKAEGVEVLNVAELTPFATHYVLATAPNPRALGAYKDVLKEAFEKENIEVPVSEGNPESGWVIVQGGDVVVHLFMAANRKDIDLAGLLGEISKKQKER